MEGYYLPDTVLVDKPLHSKIFPGKKFTYIDEAVKAKKHVPSANYEIMGNMIIKGHKSNLEKCVRMTMPV